MSGGTVHSRAEFVYLYLYLYLYWYICVLVYLCKVDLCRERMVWAGQPFIVKRGICVFVFVSVSVSVYLCV